MHKLILVLAMACLAMNAIASGDIRSADQWQEGAEAVESSMEEGEDIELEATVPAAGCPAGTITGPWVVEEQFTQCGGTPYFANWFRANTCLPKINTTSGGVDSMMVWNWNTTDLAWYETNFAADDTECNGDALFLPTRITTDCGGVWPNVGFWGSSCSQRGHGISSAVWSSSIPASQRTPVNANLYIEYSSNQVLSYFNNLFNTTFLNSVNTCVNKATTQSSAIMVCSRDNWSINYLQYRGKGCKGRPTHSRTFHSPNFAVYNVGRGGRVPTDFVSRWFCF